MALQLKELAGQSDAVERIRAGIESDRLHHALLFAGPDGVGKFEAAVSVARLLCCGSRSGLTACGICPGCLKFAAGAHPDVTVLEANEKGHITVEAIRDAIDILHLRPLEAPTKILLVRDADTMNLAAQNAFLKTLEEPPGQARIILSTSRADSLLLTVRSRCARIGFRPVPRRDLVALLRTRTPADAAAAGLIAALAHGSPARALSTNAEVVLQRRDQMAKIDDEIAPGKKAAIRLALKEALDLSEADDLKERLLLLETWLRDQIIVATNAHVEIANEDRKADLEAIANARDLTDILRRAQALEEARAQLNSPYNYKSAFIVEQLLIRFAGYNGRAQ